VRIATRRQQAEDLYPFSTYYSSPVSHKVGGGHHLDRRRGGCGGRLGNSWLRLVHHFCLGLAVISAGSQESGTEQDEANS